MLTEWLQDSAWLDGAGNFLLGAAAVLTAAFGWRAARPKSLKAANELTVSGALIDGRQADRLQHAITDLTSAVERAAGQQERTTEQIEDAAEELRRGIGEIARLREEVIRRAAGH